MAVSFFGILILLMVFGGGATVLGLIVLAVSNGRAGLAAIVGGLAFLFVVGFVAIVCIYLARSSQRSVMTSAPVWTVNGVQQPPPFPSGVHTTWNFGTTRTVPNFALTPVLFMVCGAVALIVIAARRGLAHSAAGGHGRIWPAFLVLPLLALFLIGNVRYQSTSSHAEQAARQSQMIQQQQIAIAKQVAAMSNDVQNRIANMDIHELMDKFDAPRIMLQAPSAPMAAPAAMAIAAAQVASDTAKTNSKKASATNSNKERTQAKSKHPTKPSSDSTGVANVDKPAVSAEAALSEVAAARPEASTGSRPAWIDESPKRTGPVRREVIATEEYESVDECYQAGDVYLLLKTYEHLMQLIGRPYENGALPSITFHQGMILADGNVISMARNRPAWTDTRLRQLNDMGIGIDYLRRKIVASDSQNNETRAFVENTNRSVGPMKKLYMQIEFSPAVDHELQQQWDAYNRQERFAYVGLGAGSVLGLLSMVWGLLKIDTATKGYYTKRLFIGVPAAIIGGSLLLLFWDYVI